MTSPQLPGIAPPPNPGAGVTVQSVLRTLSKERLLDVARDHGLTLSPRDTIANLARDAERSRQVDLPGVLSRLLRDDLVCLDDDAQGRALEVLWELELGARVIEPEAKASAATQASTPASTSPPTSTPSAGTPSPPPTDRSSRPPSAPASSS
jgi:hypothetical protein